MRHFRCHVATTVMLLAIAQTGAAQTVTATFPVGSVAGGTVSMPGVVVGRDGSVLMLWRDFAATKSTTRARRYSAAGLPLGSENRLGSVDIARPNVHADLRDGYIATWREVGDHTQSVVAQRLTAAGAPVRAEIPVVRVEVNVPSDVTAVSVSGTGISSGLAFAWSRSGQIFVSLYDADGAPIDAFITVGGGNGVIDALPLPDGGFLVMWTGSPSADGTLARLFDADGTPRGPEIRISEYLGGPNQFAASHLAVASTGAFAVVGARAGLGPMTEIVARRFDAAGVPRADAFVVDAVPDRVADPDVAYDSTGNLYVVWSAGYPNPTIPNPPLVRARGYDVTGAAIGPSMAISTSPGFGVRTAALPSGGFVNVWYAADQGFGAVVSLCAPGAATCGDGVFVSQCEECDAGGANDDATADACRTDCRVAHCGDGVVDGGEQCDDGNAVGCDGCGATCQTEQGVGCGDGIREPSCEACDDGNATVGDGCTPQCALERIPGGGSPASDCFSEWIVDNAANTPIYDVHGAISGRQRVSTTIRAAISTAVVPGRAPSMCRCAPTTRTSSRANARPVSRHGPCCGRRRHKPQPTPSSRRSDKSSRRLRASSSVRAPPTSARRSTTSRWRFAAPRPPTVAPR